MKVRVKNFQSIADAEIEVDGFTVITGSNNSGKTALIRALRGAFQNTGGNTFVRHGTDSCRVEVDLGDADFTWEKGHKIKPTYEIGSKTLNPGREIPKEITDLGVRSITAGGREIYPQIANQFTGQVFLVDQPGSVLAEAVADVERVGKLNRSLKLAEKDKRSASSELKVRKKDLKTYEEDLLLFEGVDDVDGLVSNCEKALAKIEKIGGWVSGLKGLRDRYAVATEVVESLSGVQDGFEDFENAGTDELNAILSDLDSLVALKSRWDESLGELSLAQEAISSAGSIDLPSTAKLEKCAKALKVFHSLQSKLGVCAEQVSSLQGDIAKAEQELADLEQEIKDTLGELGECPTCGATHSDRSSNLSVVEVGGAL